MASGLKGLTNDGNAITLGSGGFLTTGTGTFNLGGGLLSGATASDDLILHIQRDTNIGNALIGAGTGNLVKTGPGQLNLFGTSSFTGSINVSGGLLGVNGGLAFPGALGGATTAANRTINLNNGGGFHLTTGSWDLNDFDLVTAGVQSMTFNIGSGGGTLSSRDGQLLINDTNGQFGGTGDLTIAGGGRVAFDLSAYNFNGDTTVTGGVLRLGNTGSLGSSSQQTISMGAGTSLILGAAQNQAFNFKDSEITPVGGDRQFLGSVNFSGTNRLVTVARDALGTGGSLGFHGDIGGSGTLELYGLNSNGRVQFANGINTFTGDINLNANTTVEARLPGSLGQAPGAITLNFLGANSGVRLRHYQNGDYNANLNVRNNVEFQYGRHESYTSGAQQLLSFNNLTVGSGNRWITTNADNGYWLDIKGTATAAGNLTLNLNSGNLLLEQGLTAAGTFDKRGSGFLATRGAINAGKVLIASGLLELRGGGSITATNGVELRGGSLLISQDVDGGANPNRYTGALTLGGGALRVIGDTNLGTVTAAPGQTDVIYTSATQGNTQTPLVLTGFTRTAGSQINFGTDFGTIGRESTTTSNPRILLPGQADTFGTGAVGSVDIIPWARVGNEFAGYRTQTDLGTALGVFPVTNTFMQTDPAEGSLTSSSISRFTTATTTTLTASRSTRAIKMDGTATRTIDIGAANTLTIERGAVIHVGGGNNRIGVAATGGKIQAGAGVSELFLTTNGAELQIGAGIQNNGATALSIVKNGAGTLLFDGTAATSANTFSGNIHLNAGLVANTLANHIPSTATINFNGGRWEPRIDPGSATGGNIAMGNNIVVNSTSLSIGGDPALSLDNGSVAANVNGTYQFGRLTINNAATWSVAGWDQMDATFTAASGQQHLFNSSGGIAPTIETIHGRTAAAAGESVFTFAGAMSGDAGLILNSRGARAGTASHPVIVLGGGASDTAANNFGGVLEIGLTTNASDTGALVRLNKAPGTNAIGSQGVIIGGGSLRNEANEQIADTADVTINGYASSNNNYGWALNSRTETIGSLTQNGGAFGTGLVFTPNASGSNIGGTLIVSDNGGLTSGKLAILGGGGINQDIFSLNSASSVTAKSVEITKYGRMVLSTNNATDTVLTVGTGGLTLEGTQILLLDGTSTNSRIVLNGNVTTQPSAIQAALTTASEADNKLDLGGSVRTFNVADGTAGDDLAISLTVQNGGLTKSGAGTLVLGGASLFHSNALNTNAGGANLFTGPTLVTGGELHLNKANGTNAIASNSVQVGNLTGTSRLVLRNSNQIINTADVSLAADGVLDLQSYNASESIGNLTSTAGGTTLLGPDSALAVNVTSDSVYAGSIQGGGSATAAVTLTGTAKWSLNGSSEYSGDTVVNGGTLAVNGFINGSEITVNAGGTLGGTGDVSDVVLNGGTLAPGNSTGLLGMRNLTTTSGTYLAEINGTSLAADGLLYDVAEVNGTVNLGAGTTTLTLNLGYAPALGDAFWLVLNDGLDPINGIFAGLPEGGTLVSGAYTFQATYLANGSTSGSSSLTGGNDMALLTIAVPEASTAALAGLTTALLAFRRRRRAA